jgi:hypothetical protein
MSADPFAGPASVESIQYEEYKGALLLFTVHSLEREVKTTLGTKDAISASIAVLDGPRAGKTIDNTLVFPQVLQGQLRARIGSMCLGRLGQGDAKPGQNAPWKLSDPTDADKTLARSYLSHSEQPPF